MTEADIQADYTRKVIAARAQLAKTLETRILNLKAERDTALELIREGDTLNESEQVKAVEHNENGGGSSEEGKLGKGSPESGLEGEEGEGQDPPQDPPQE